MTISGAAVMLPVAPDVTAVPPPIDVLDLSNAGLEPSPVMSITVRPTVWVSLGVTCPDTVMLTAVLPPVI